MKEVLDQFNNPKYWEDKPAAAKKEPKKSDALALLTRSIDARCKSLKKRLTEDVAAQLADPDRPASELAHVYGAFRDIAEELASATKIVSDAVSLLGMDRIPKAFEREGITTFTTKSGYRVTVSERYVASIKKENKDEAYAWLRKNGLDALIVETVNASTLSAAGKAMIEEKGKELPEALFTTAYLPGTSLTKVKKK